MLATRRPEAISALNVLEATVAAIGRSQGAMVEVVLAIGEDRLIARITRRSRDGPGPGPRSGGLRAGQVDFGGPT